MVPNNVRSFFDYKIERERRYPNVGTKSIDYKTVDWHEHKKWLEKELKRIEREAHNAKVSKEYEAMARGEDPHNDQ